MSELEARREARRRRILENAENRLKKITNREEHSEEQSIDSVGASSKTSINYRPSLNNFSKNTGHIQLGSTKDANESHVIHDRRRVSFDPTTELRTIYQNSAIEDNESAAEMEFQNYDEKKSLLRDWIIVLLAVTVRYLFLLCEQFPDLISRDFLFSYHLNKVFIPFFLYQIMEYSFFKPLIPPSSLLNMLFVINLGVPVETIHKIVMVSRVASRIMQDMMVYFFAFVSIDQLIVSITQERN